MEQFSDFAYIYDKLNVNYDKQNIIARIKQLVGNRKEIVDLCCGTGDVAIALAKSGHSVTGVDISEDMLNVANEKAMKSAARVMFVCEDAKKLMLMKKADALYSLTDGMNYMLGEDELEKAFRSVNKALKCGGLFIFDVSTPYKYKNLLANNVYTFDFDDAFLCWQNEYNEHSKICRMSITGFNKTGKNTYSRFDEEHLQYCHSVESIERTLKNAGFELDCIYSGYTEEVYKECDERVLITAYKREEIK